MKSERRIQIISITKKCWAVLAFVGLAYYLWHNWHQIIATVRAIPMVNLIGALVCIVLGKLTALYLMRASLVLQTIRLAGWREYVWVYASTDVAKYIPGGVWAIVGRVVQYRNYGMSAAAISKALFFENMIFGVSALLLGLPVGVGLFWAEQRWLMALSVAVVFIVALSLLLAARLAWRRGLLRLDDNAVRITLLALIVMLLGWIAMGTSFFLLFPEKATVQYWLWSVGSYATAFVTGMVAVFAPAGAGVREGVLVLIGQFIDMPSAMMLDAAILSRAIWVIADTCVFIFALVIRLSGK